MGILVLGVGIGGAGVFGSLLHVINNGFTKGLMFLAAGNIHRAFGGKTTDVVSGALRKVPWSGALFLLGFFAVTGSPPFAPFVSEFAILSAAFEERKYAIGATFLILLVVVFIGMGATVLAVVQGKPTEPAAPPRVAHKESLFMVGPPALFLVLVLVLGVYVPEPLKDLVDKATHFVEASQ
jgi:hydrogenase-4 component F